MINITKTVCHLTQLEHRNVWWLSVHNNILITISIILLAGRIHCVESKENILITNYDVSALDMC